MSRWLLPLMLAACYVPADTVARSKIDGDFFEGPWPDDRRLKGGKLRTASFPNPFSGDFADNLFQSGDGLVDGFGLQSPIYVPFSGPIDPASLPQDAQASLAEDASVRFLAVDSGERVPFEWHWYAAPTPFLPGNVLAVRPVVGFPLRPKTRYALIVTTSVKDSAGTAVGPDRETWEAEARGTAIAIRFTTQPLLEELHELRDFLQTQPPPTVHDLTLSSTQASAWVFRARYPAPLLLHGAPPYEQEGGEFQRASDGTPVIATVEELRLALVLPRSPMPQSGFPLVMYSHGTGGAYSSVIGDIGLDLAELGIASVGIDQVLHGPRVPDGASCFGLEADICFFNPVNAVAGRNLARHAALDHVTLARALEGLTVPLPDGALGRFDFDRLGFFGHSQGGLSGAIYAAIEPRLRAVVLSGTGGHLTTTVLERKDPIDLRVLAEGPLFLNLQGQDTLDPYHPALALVQTLGDAADPMSYAPYWLENGQSVFLTSGLEDPYTPWQGALAMAAAAGIPQLLPDATASLAHTLRALSPVALPLSGNVDGKTAGLRQFPDEGHFPVFGASATAQWREFFASAFSDFPVAPSLIAP